MAHNVVISSDLGKGVDLEGLQMSFHGASSASLDYISDPKVGIVSMDEIIECNSTIHRHLLPVRQILRFEGLSALVEKNVRQQERVRERGSTPLSLC